MENLTYKVDDILEKVGVQVDVSECNHNGYNEMGKKLDVIKKFVDVTQGVKDLDILVKTFKGSCSVDTVQPPEAVKEEDFTEAFRKCSSVKDVETKFQEFKYSFDLEKIICDVCEKPAAAYSADYEEVEIQSREFRNVKISLKKHLASEGHLAKIKKSEVCSLLSS